MMDTYRERVRQARLTRSSEIIYNQSHDHAAVLIEELFYAAEAEVGILSRELDPDVYGRPAVINAAQGFLERDGAKLSLIVEGDVPDDHPFIAHTRGNPRYAGQVRVTSGFESLKALPFNFMVSDGIAYRYEADKDEAVATACFNDRATADQMLELIHALVPIGGPAVELEAAN